MKTRIQALLPRNSATQLLSRAVVVAFIGQMMFGCTSETTVSEYGPGSGLDGEGEPSAEACHAPRDLYRAIQFGDANCVLKALQEGAKPNEVFARDTFRDGNILPLEYALESSPVIFARESARVVNVLLKGGADPNKLFRDGGTALAKAIAQGGDGYDKIAAALVAWHKTEINRVDPLLSETPLILALDRKNQLVIDALLKRADLNVDVSRRDGDSAATIAVDNKQFDLAVQLLSRGASVNSTTGSGVSILTLAIAANAQNVVEKLLASDGLDVNAVGNQGESALHAAVESDKSSLVGELLSRKASVAQTDPRNQTALHKAKSVAVGELLLKAGASPKARDNTNSSPLAYAVRGKQSELAALLLANGADPNEATQAGQTLIFQAIASGDNALVQHLIKAGANIDHRDNQGSSTLLYAVLQNNGAAALSVLAAGASMTAENEEGDSPARVASQRGQQSVLLALLNKGLDVNKADGSGRVPLHAAKNSEIASLLISRGGKVDLRDNNGETPLSNAVRSGSLDVVTALLKSGADQRWVDKRKRGLLSVALAGNHVPVADLLIRSGVDVNGLGTNEKPILSVRSLTAAEVLTAHNVKLIDEEELLWELYLTLANNFGEQPIAEIFGHLVKKGARPSAVLRNSIQSDNVAITEALLSNGMPIEAAGKSVNKATSLRMVQLLILHKAELGEYLEIAKLQIPPKERAVTDLEDRILALKQAGVDTRAYESQLVRAQSDLTDQMKIVEIVQKYLAAH